MLAGTNLSLDLAQGTAKGAGMADPDHFASFGHTAGTRCL